MVCCFVMCWQADVENALVLTILMSAVLILVPKPLILILLHKSYVVRGSVALQLFSVLSSTAV